MNKRKRPKILIFDFDGTLVDSNPIKMAAFGKCFEEYQDKYPEIMHYCRSHHHTSRFVKFRYVFENILQQPYPPQVETRLLERYAAETTQRIIEAPEIPGALAFLQRWSQLGLSGLVSTTPHEVLLTILEQRKMRSYFAWIQGAPVIKADWLQHFCRTRGLAEEEVIFIGDTPEDAQAASMAGILFVDVKGGEVFQDGASRFFG